MLKSTDWLLECQNFLYHTHYAWVLFTNCLIQIIFKFIFNKIVKYFKQQNSFFPYTIILLFDI